MTDKEGCLKEIKGVIGFRCGTFPYNNGMCDILLCDKCKEKKEC